MIPILLIIAMLQCLILGLIYFIQEKLNKNNKQIEAPLKKEQELEFFRHGARQNWFAVNICLYKMWDEMDILDYDVLTQKLQQNLEEMINNPDRLKEWSDKFNEYVNQQGK